MTGKGDALAGRGVCCWDNEFFLFGVIAAVTVGGASGWAQVAELKQAVVLRAARMLDVSAGRVLAPGEVLVVGERIVEAGEHVRRPAGGW
jgi:hypothetical protein